MPFSFELLKITQLIVHRIYARVNDEVPEPRISTTIMKLSFKGLDTLQNRIVKALGSGHHGIEMDVRRIDEGSFFSQAARALNDDDMFVVASGKITEYLNETQASRRLPGGVVVVIKGIVGPQKHQFLAVIKAEVHEGFSTKESENEVLMTFIDELALTPNQKLYKIGFLVFSNFGRVANDNEEPDMSQYRAFLYDHNMTTNETRTAASYFYSQFLGFEVRQSDKKLTKDFYELTKAFIVQSNMGDREKLDVQQSLYVQLKVSNKTTVQISEFAENYLPAELCDDYVKYMTDNKFPETAVTKDIDYISKLLRRQKLQYSNDIVLSGPSENFEKLVTVVSEDAESTTIRIAGKLKK